MRLEANHFDLALLATVALQATSMAYLRAPRLKALVLCLPLPFTLVSLSLGRPVDVTNLLGVIAIIAYVHLVRILHQGAGIAIVPVIVAGVAAYCGLGWLLLWLTPVTDRAFWALGTLLLAAGASLHRHQATRSEPGHRTPLPVWLKLPLVLLVVSLLLVVKESLQGVATMFPMVSVPGAYEARHSLWTMSRQMPVFVLTVVPLMMVARLAQPHVGIVGGLALGWLAFLALLVPLVRDLWAREAGGGPEPARSCGL
jgi:hypothetical protein